MSNVGGTRPEAREIATVRMPKGTARVMADKIASIACPNCGTHIRAGHRPEVFCRYCKQEIVMDSDYRFLMGIGINSQEWSYHAECYDKAIQEGEFKDRKALQSELTV